MSLWCCRALGADYRRAELQYWRWLLRYSGAFTVPVFMLAMVLPMMPGCDALFKAHLLGFPLDELLKWALATPVQFWIGWRFHAGAWKALRNGRYTYMQPSQNSVVIDQGSSDLGSQTCANPL